MVTCVCFFTRQVCRRLGGCYEDWLNLLNLESLQYWHAIYDLCLAYHIILKLIDILFSITIFKSGV